MPHNIYDVYVTIPPDGGYSWVIAIISFIGFIIADGVGSSFFLYREHIAEDLVVSTTMVAAVGSVYSSLCLFYGPISSALCNLYGFRWMLIIGGILTSSGFGLSYFSESYFMTLLCFGVTAGIGGGCALIPLTAPVGYWFDKRRPIALGASTSGTGIGMIIVPYTTQLLMKNLGWKWAFIYHSVLFSLYIALGVFLIPLTPVKIEPSSSIKKDKDFKVTPSPIKLKAHDKYHPRATRLFPAEALRPTSADPWTHASSIRILGKLPQDIKKPGYANRILPRPNFVTESVLYREQKHPAWYMCVCCKKRYLGHRPLYKTDIFYPGSLLRIKEGKSRETAIDYAMSVTRLPTKVDIAQEHKLCVCCPEAVRRTMNTMCDFTLMKKLSFLLFLLSNFCFTMGSCLPILYIYNEAEKKQFPEYLLQWLVPSIGIGTFAGRLLAGLLLQLFPFIEAFHICTSVNFAVSIATFGIIFIDYTFYYFIYTTTFGIFSGIFTSVRSLILVDYLGLDQLTTATGILFAFGGSALLLGPPIADFLKNYYNESSIPIFYFAGALMTLSFIFLTLMLCVKKDSKTSIK